MTELSKTRSTTPIAYRKKPVAVIDIGSTAVRMAIAEITSDGTIRPLEELTQAIALGKDTFTKGVIAKSTMEECVQVLISYRSKLREYQIDSPEQIRLVATSAVREAQNRLAFLDRIFVATSLEVDVLDEAVVHRIIYRGAMKKFKQQSFSLDSQTIVAEVGGGSTELLALNQNDIVFSHALRLGSLRLRETLEAYQTPGSKLDKMMTNRISQMLEPLASQIPDAKGKQKKRQLFCLGSDVRFAADQLHSNRDPSKPFPLSVSKLQQLTDKLLELTTDEITKLYHLSLPDAESITPSLLINLELAKVLDVDTIHVLDVNLRDGLLLDLASQGVWSNELQRQVIRSAVTLGRKFEVEESHALHVAKLSKELFQTLQPLHQLGPKHELFLYVAALLHEVGLFISNAGYHKHTLYLILNSELFGLSRQDLQLTALVARYHRKASPKESHSAFNGLSRDERIAVTKMAALLRVAIALNASRCQRIQDFTLRPEGKRKLVISVPDLDDLSMEQLALRQTASLFEEIFGKTVQLRSRDWNSSTF